MLAIIQTSMAQDFAVLSLRPLPEDLAVAAQCQAPVSRVDLLPRVELGLAERLRPYSKGPSEQDIGSSPIRL